MFHIVHIEVDHFVLTKIKFFSNITLKKLLTYA